MLVTRNFPVGLILISELLCLLHHPISFGLRLLSFSSVTVILSDLSWTNTFNYFPDPLASTGVDFLTLTRLRLRSTVLFGITALRSTSFVDFSFTYSCNSPLFSSSVVPCHSALLRAVHLTHQLLMDMNSCRFYTGQHCSRSPCDSRLNHYVLAAVSLVWPISRTSHCATRQHHPKVCLLCSTLLLNTEASSNQLLLFADRVKLSHRCRDPRRAHVVLLGRAFCRVLVQRSGLVLAAQHPLFGLLTSFCP